MANYFTDLLCLIITHAPSGDESYNTLLFFAVENLQVIILVVWDHVMSLLS